MSAMSQSADSVQWDMFTQDASSSDEDHRDGLRRVTFGISANVSTARTDDELGDKLHRDRKKPVWAMFGSSWCHHCHELFPSVYAMSKKYPKSEFVVAQMDFMDAAVKGIRYTPTFRLYKEGRRLDEFVGTDAQRVEDHVWLWSDPEAKQL